MKRYILFAFLALVSLKGFAVTTYFYNPGASGVTDRLNWWTLPGGTGTQLALGGFTAGNNTFEIRNSVTIITANWTVSGANAKVIVGNIGIAGGITFTIPSGFTLTGTVDVVNGTSGTNTLDIANTSIPTLGIISNGSTVSYSAAGAQTVAIKTYQNLILAGSGAKNTTSVTVNGKLSMQGTATASVAPTYGSSATLEYNSSLNLTAGPEWITPFIATGGVSIINTGIVTLNAAKQIGNNTSVPLQIASGATLSTSASNYTLTLHGDLINAGTLTGNASAVVIGGTTSAQNIGGFTTTGLISMTKTSGTATMAGNLPQTGTGSFPLTINGTGGTIIFGGTSTFTTTGTLTVQNGFMRLNNVVLVAPTIHSHQVGDFTMTGGTVDFSDKDFQPNLTVILNVSGNYSKTGGTLQTNNVIANGYGSFGLINFNGTIQSIKCTTAFTTNLQCTYYVASGTTCTLSPGFNFNLGPASTYESFNVRSGGTLVCGATDVVINNGPGYFTLSGGGTLKTANVNGINSAGFTGSIQTGTRYFASDANLEYNGTTAQNTGVFTTSPTVFTVNNLSINNTPKFSGLVTAQQDFTVNGVYAADNGVFAIGGIAGTPQTLTLNGTITNADDNYDRFRANGFSNVTIGNTGAGGSGPLGYQLFFDQSSKGNSAGTGGSNDLTILTPGTTNNVRNFTMNRPSQTVVLQTEMQVNNLVNITAGTLASGGSGTGNSTNLVLLSTATTTSSVLELVSGASITGGVVVQSFFKGGTVATNRGFRMISSPIVEATAPRPFFQQIQDRFIVTCSSNQNYPLPATGCDYRPVQAPYAQTLVGYIEGPTYVASSFDNSILPTTAAVKGKGYYFFFRGSRANLNATTAGKINAPLADPEDWTAAYTGVINSGDVTFPVTKTGTGSFSGICLVGNPYPSTLDISTFFTDNVGSTAGQPLSNYISILNPLRTGFYTASGGVTNGNLGTPISGSGGPYNLQYIQPGQGFFVKSNYSTGTGTVTFKESQKASATNSPTAIRLLDAKQGGILDGTLATKAIPRKLIRINLQNGVTREDATIVLEKGNDANFGGDDAIYFNNNDLLCNTLTADGKPTCINFMPEVNQVSRISLLANSTTTNANLKLNFSELSGLGDSQMLLVDSFTHTSTRISNANKTYVFGIDRNVKKSYDPNRFMLEFYSAGDLSMKIDAFKAIINDKGVKLSWNTFSEHNSRETVIERSVDGVNFYTIGSIAAAGNSSTEIKYSYTDVSPMAGRVYYRLKMLQVGGSFTYSDTKSVYFGLDEENEITLYPNPIMDEINVRWSKDHPVDLTVYDMMGKTVKLFTEVLSDNFHSDFTDLAVGVYTLVLREHNGGKRIATKHFVKK
jgi:hypothetical protein